MNKKITLSTTIVILFCVLAAVVVFRDRISETKDQEIKYNEACLNEDEGYVDADLSKLDLAQKSFLSLGNYRDSETRLAVVKNKVQTVELYLKGVRAYNDSDFTTAYNCMRSLGDYKDVATFKREIEKYFEENPGLRPDENDSDSDKENDDETRNYSNTSYVRESVSLTSLDAMAHTQYVCSSQYERANTGEKYNECLCFYELYNSTDIQSVVFYLGGKYKLLCCDLGLLQSYWDNNDSSFVGCFKFYDDETGRLLFESKAYGPGSLPDTVNVDVTGVRKLGIVVTGAPDYHDCAEKAGKFGMFSPILS